MNINLGLDQLRNSTRTRQGIAYPSITLLHLNTQSLRNKLSEIEIILQDVPVHFLCINEHWLDESQIQLFVPSNYKLMNYFCRNLNEHGGVAIYMRGDLSYDYTSLDMSCACEPGIVEVTGIKVVKLKLILISIYRVPNYNIEIFLEKLEVIYNLFKNHNKFKFVIIGDLNVNILESQSNMVKKFMEILNSLNWSLCNNLPTRYKTCLDNIIIPVDSTTLYCGTMSPSPSDHLGLWAILPFASLVHEHDDLKFEIQNKLGKKTRRLGISNILNLRQYLHNTDFSTILCQNKDIHSEWQTFVDLVLEGVHRHCPLIYKVPSGNRPVNHNPWYTPELHKLKRLMLAYYVKANAACPTALNYYVKLKKKYKSEIIKAKISYNNHVIANSRNKNSAAWSIIKREHSELKYNIPPHSGRVQFVLC
jgi:hypothetical protein